MTKEELKTLTNKELINELYYCRLDSYYNEYRTDIIAEIKKRIREPVLNKISEEVDALKNYSYPFSDMIFDEV